MGYAKRLVKNKARVEGSICASYLHHETTHCCSHYFNKYMLSQQSTRNEADIESERDMSMLSIFDQLDRRSGRELTHWLTDEELKLAYEVKPYLE